MPAAKTEKNDSIDYALDCYKNTINNQNHENAFLSTTIDFFVSHRMRKHENEERIKRDKHLATQHRQNGLTPIQL